MKSLVNNSTKSSCGRYLSIFVLSIFIFAFNSCVNDSSLDDENGETAFGIRHDKDLSEYEALATNLSSEVPNFSSVVAFSYSLDGSDNNDYTATGTLIDEEWILTAGHNFYDAQDQSNPAPASGVSVLVGNDPNNPDLTLTVSKIECHPTWLSGDQDYNDANDLCLVKLSTPITTLMPIPLHTEWTEQIGSLVWFAGFGDYSGTDGQNPDLDSKKHAIKNILDRKQDGFETTANGINYTGGLLAFDFDDPDGIINSLGDDIINEDEGYLGSGSSQAIALDFEGTTVEGDSGGPLFILNGNVWELAGVLSRGAFDPIDNHVDSSYGDISIFTRVSTSYDWIISVIE